MKTFTVAGYSKINGVKKMRFANDLANRVKKLMVHGHTDIQLLTLPNAMTKDEIRVYLGDTPAQLATTEAAAPTVTETPTTYATIEAALAAVPLRAKGRFIKKEVRLEMARELMVA